MEMSSFWVKNLTSNISMMLANIIRRNCLTEFCSNYIDDIIVFSQTFEEHLEHLQILFEKFE